jgi:ascorbate-specific PTS system EIIC-type component UlaA
MVGRNWPLGNKSIDIENLKLIKVLKFFIQIIVLKWIILMIFY